MAHFDPGPVPKEITPKWMKKLLTYLQDSLNYLDERNFPNKVSGSIIKPGTLLVQMSELEWREMPVPLVLPAQPVGTTLTTGANLGGYFLWNPNAYPGGDWYLEASISVSDTKGISTCTLVGATEIGSVSTQETTLTIVRSDKLSMPKTPQNMWVTLKTSNSDYTASLAGARLIFVPN